MMKLQLISIKLMNQRGKVGGMKNKREKSGYLIVGVQRQHYTSASDIFQMLRREAAQF